MNRLVGLSGAQRTGKTTLAKELAQSSLAIFVPADIAGKQAELGFDSRNQSYSFGERLLIQEHLLTRMEEEYVKLTRMGTWYTTGVHVPNTVITDRTPLDLICYLMMAINDECTDEDFRRLESYIHKAMNIHCRYFSAAFIVQPGIPIVEDLEKSAKGSKAFMMKFNILLLHWASMQTNTTVIPPTVLDLQERVEFIREACARF